MGGRDQGARGQRAPAVALVLLLLHAFVYSGCGEDEIGGRGVSGRGAVGRIIWMMQGKHELDLSYLRGEHSDAIQVVWGAPPSGTYADTHFLPNSTCTEGRNFLLQLAFEKGVARGEQYLYFIYTEDDAELEEIIGHPLSPAHIHVHIHHCGIDRRHASMPAHIHSCILTLRHG